MYVVRVRRTVNSYAVQLSSVTTRTAAPAKPKLGRDAVMDAAMAIADAEGLDAVTIRRIATGLSVTPMALYWHFKDKDALLAAMADRMWEGAQDVLEHSIAQRESSRSEGDECEGDDWTVLRLTLDALLTVMRRHPAIAPLAPHRVMECEAGLAITERTLACLAERGFDPERAAVIARYVLCSALMLVDSEPGAMVGDPAERAESERRKKIALASLPVERYPHVSASAEYFTSCAQADAYFDEGVELVLAGVRHQAPAPPTAKRRSRAKR